jgi:hypothetical protein
VTNSSVKKIWQECLSVLNLQELFVFVETGVPRCICGEVKSAEDSEIVTEL